MGFVMASYYWFHCQNLIDHFCQDYLDFLDLLLEHHFQTNWIGFRLVSNYESHLLEHQTRYDL